MCMSAWCEKMHFTERGVRRILERLLTSMTHSTGVDVRQPQNELGSNRPCSFDGEHEIHRVVLGLGDVADR